MKISMRYLAAVLTVLAVFASIVPARAGQSEIDLLAAYVGDWRGESALTGGDEPEPFRCRLTVAKGNQNRINYTGRCSLVHTNLSISGTIAYVDDKNHYEAVMSSNAGFTGAAVGLIRNKTISFDLRKSQRDRSGSDVRIGARIVLVEDTITVEFEVEFNESGKILTASVPFAAS